MKNKYYRVVLNCFESGDVPDFPIYVEEVNNKFIDIVSNEEIVYSSRDDFLSVKGFSYNDKYLVDVSDVICSLKSMSSDDVLSYRKSLYYFKKKICSDNISFGNSISSNIYLDLNDKDSVNMYKEKNRVRKQVFKVIEIDD